MTNGITLHIDVNDAASPELAEAQLKLGGVVEYRGHTINLEKGIWYAVFNEDGKYQDSGVSLEEAKRFIDFLVDVEEGEFAFQSLEVQ